jgi:hypothetical protein
MVWLGVAGHGKAEFFTGRRLRQGKPRSEALMRITTQMEVHNVDWKIAQRITPQVRGRFAHRVGARVIPCGGCEFDWDRVLFDPQYWRPEFR